jgi:hypothetical protein
MMTSEIQTRPLSSKEVELSRWLLENGNDEANQYLEQLGQSEATTWVCACGCASFNFKVKGREFAPPGVHILGDFVFGSNEELAGVFIYSSNGILSGVEVYGLAGDAPTSLPHPEELKPI